MGQVRQDSHEQRAAKQRVADSRRCPACDRRSALSSPKPFVDDFDGEVVGRVRECLYCGHAVGSLLGKSFGRATSGYATQEEAEAALIAEGKLDPIET